MSAYATALTESPKEYVVKEALEQHDRAVKAEKVIEHVVAVYHQVVQAIEQHKARSLGGMQAPGSVLSHAPMSALKVMERDLRFALDEHEEKPKTQMEQVTDMTADAVAATLKKEGSS